MMRKWKIGAIIGAIWGLISIKIVWSFSSLHTFIDNQLYLTNFSALIFYTICLPNALATLIGDLLLYILGWWSFPYIAIFCSPFTIGALIGATVGFLIDKYRR